MLIYTQKKKNIEKKKHKYQMKLSRPPKNIFFSFDKNIKRRKQMHLAKQLNHMKN